MSGKKNNTKPKPAPKGGRNARTRNGARDAQRVRHYNESEASLQAANALTRGLAMSSLRPREPKRNSKGTLMNMKFSLAAAKYVAAMLNPFSLEAEGAFIPIGNGRPTQKLKTVSRFDITIGTNGIGWVIVAPCNANCVVAMGTNALYTGVSAIPYAVAATATLNTGVFIVSPPTGYSAASVFAPYNAPGTITSGEVYGRVVAASMTVQYTGKTLDEGGLLYCYTDPDHNSVVGETVATLGQRLGTDVVNQSRQKCTVTDYPLKDSEAYFDRTAEFNATNATTGIPVNVATHPFSHGTVAGPDSAGSYAFPTAAGPTTFAAPTMIVMASGTAGNTLHVELVQHLEFQGPGAEGKTTPTPIDRAGFELVTSVVSNMASERISRSMGNHSEQFANSYRSVMASLKPASSAILRSAIG